MSGLRLSFRLAWRAARRERLATFLTALLVALPVVALVAAGILASSSKVSNRLDTERRYGQADVAITRTVDTAKLPGGGGYGVAGPGPLPAGPLADLPAGSRLITETTRSSDILTVADGSVSSSVNPYELQADDPLAKGILVFRTGRYPTAPGEIAMTTYLAHRLGVRVGDTVHLARLGAEHVVATVDDPTYLHAREVYSVEGAFAAVPAQFVLYLASLPPGSDASQLTLPAAFSATATRLPTATGLPGGNSINTGALVLLLALLEASLTAGTAFAVGARRRRRDLALVAANGGRPGHTAGVVLAGGIVCGLIGIVVGLGVGVGAARLSYPLLQHHSSALLPGFRVSPVVLLASAAFGLVSALISCALPAYLVAKGSLRAALGKSRGSSGTPGWITAAGAGVFALGVAVMSAAVRDASRGNSQQTTTALIGVVFVELGGVAVCPALLGLAGRFGARLPALPRLALRDAARQRARSGPAVAAIAAAVSGAMALSVYFASDHLKQVRDYQPLIPRNLVSVSQLNNDGSDITNAQLAGAIGAGPAAHSARSMNFDPQSGDSGVVIEVVDADHPDNASLSENSSGNILVAGADLLKLLGATPQAQRAIDRGEIVVGGTITIPPTIRFSGMTGQTAVVTPPFASVSAGWPEPRARPLAVMSQATALRVAASFPKTATTPDVAGADLQTQVWAPLPTGLSDAARNDYRSRADDLGISLMIDSGPGDTDTLVTLALLGVAGIFALIVTAAATVLAAAESQADLSILGAVGASGPARRVFTAAQGATTALLGGGLGLLIGLVPGIAVVRANSRLPLTVPWQPFAAFLVGLPLLAALGGVVFSRSRLPGVSRTL